MEAGVEAATFQRRAGRTNTQTQPQVKSHARPLVQHAWSRHKNKLQARASSEKQARAARPPTPTACAQMGLPSTLLLRPEVGPDDLCKGWASMVQLNS